MTNNKIKQLVHSFKQRIKKTVDIVLDVLSLF